LLSARAGDRFALRAGLSFLTGGSWAALALVLRYRLPH
jgi:hypothetical protein